MGIVEVSLEMRWPTLDGMARAAVSFAATMACLGLNLGGSCSRHSWCDFGHLLDLVELSLEFLDLTVLVLRFLVLLDAVLIHDSHTILGF